MISGCPFFLRSSTIKLEVLSGRGVGPATHCKVVGQGSSYSWGDDVNALNAHVYKIFSLRIILFFFFFFFFFRESSSNVLVGAKPGMVVSDNFT